jgi:hypothetical protein
MPREMKTQRMLHPLQPRSLSAMTGNVPPVAQLKTEERKKTATRLSYKAVTVVWLSERMNRTPSTSKMMSLIKGIDRNSLKKWSIWHFALL